MITPAYHNLKPRFVCKSDTDGCDETVSVICLATGNVIASAAFWDDAPVIEAEAQLLATALNTLFDRGWCFQVNSLRKSIAINSTEDFAINLH